jgi:hypothetical protein
LPIGCDLNVYIIELADGIECIARGIVLSEHMLCKPLGICMTGKATNNHIVSFGLVLGPDYAGCNESNQDEEIPQGGRRGAAYRHRVAKVIEKRNKTGDIIFLLTLFSIALHLSGGNGRGNAKVK